jgi:adenylylsulfate kinase
MRPSVIWFTGLPSSGKSTLATALGVRFVEAGISFCCLDGDEIRKTISRDLGFGQADRVEQVRRVYRLAAEHLQAGRHVIVSMVSPHRLIRREARLALRSFVEVYVNCPLESCERRDIKGLYLRARKGEIKEFTGIDSVYEEPESPEVMVRTDQNDVQSCLNSIWKFLQERNSDKPSKF